jgi:hypothetical protein
VFFNSITQTLEKLTFPTSSPQAVQGNDVCDVADASRPSNQRIAFLFVRQKVTIVGKVIKQKRETKPKKQT